MNIIEQASAKKVHPSTLIKTACMNFVFDTGHKATMFAGGLISYNKKDGTALNEKSGAKLIAEMNRLMKVSA